MAAIQQATEDVDEEAIPIEEDAFERDLTYIGATCVEDKL